MLKAHKMTVSANQDLKGTLGIKLKYIETLPSTGEEQKAGG
jgi:hypothetical protein